MFWGLPDNVYWGPEYDCDKISDFLYLTQHKMMNHSEKLTWYLPSECLVKFWYKINKDAHSKHAYAFPDQ